MSEQTTWRLEDLARPDGPPPTFIADENAWKMWTLAWEEGKYSVIYGLIQQGQGTRVHRHLDEHYTTVLNGHARVWVDGKVVELSTGDVLYIPSWAKHDYRSTESGEAWILDVSSPPFDVQNMEFLPELQDQVLRDLDKAKEYYGTQ